MIAASCGGVRVVSVYAPNGRSVGSVVLPGQAGLVRPPRPLARRGGGPARAARARRRLQRRARGRRRVGRRGLPRRHPRLGAGAGGLRAAPATGGSSTSIAGSTPSPGATRWWDYRAGNFHKNYRHAHRPPPGVAAGRGARRVEPRSTARRARASPLPSDHTPLVIDLDGPGRPFDAGWASAEERIAARRAAVILEPPIEPMLAKLADGAARGRRLALRAEVGRLPRDRVPRRRRASTSRAATSSRSTATSPSWRRRSWRPCPSARRRRRDRHRHRAAGSTSTPSRCGSTRRPRAWPSSPRRRRRRSSPSISWRRATRTCARGRSPSAARGSRARARPRRRPRPSHPVQPRPRRGPGLVPPLRGRRARRRRRQARERDLPARQARDDQGQAHAHRRLRGRRASAGTRAARASWSARCCSGSTTTAGALHHVGVTSSFTTAARRQLAQELAPLRENALEGHPVAGLGRGRGRASTRMPGGSSRWSRGKDLSWEPLRIERVCEVAVRPPAGRPLPARRDLRALAAGQAARGLPLRPARGHPAGRAGRDLPRGGRAGLTVRLRPSGARARRPRRRVVRIEGLLRRAQRRRARAPGSRGRGSRSRSGPASSRRARRRAGGAGRPRGGAPSTARGRRAPPPSAAPGRSRRAASSRPGGRRRGRSLRRPRRGDAGRLAGLLGVVGRPRRVAEALGLLARPTAPAASRASRGARRCRRAGPRSRRSGPASCGA